MRWLEEELSSELRRERSLLRAAVMAMLCWWRMDPGEEGFNEATLLRLVQRKMDADRMMLRLLEVMSAQQRSIVCRGGKQRGKCSTVG